MFRERGETNNEGWAGRGWVQQTLGRLRSRSSLGSTPAIPYSSGDKRIEHEYEYGDAENGHKPTASHSYSVQRYSQSTIT
jgi:hypothetical protein